MGFRINTNVSALNAHTSSVLNNRNLSTSLEKLSSGLRINKAADDASGMAIADSLRAQGSALGQAISNANDTIGIIQTADKAMDEQIKILETIKTKATQAAQDGQNSQTRAAIQKDINRLLEELDNIAYTTSYNGQKLLAGTFTAKEFQIGAYSNETVKASIGATGAAKVGHVRYEKGTVNVSSSAENVVLTFSADGKDIKLESVNIGYSAGSGLGVLANVINKNTDATGVKASYIVQSTGNSAVTAGNIGDLKINDVLIGNISGVQANDSDGRLVNAINAMKEQTGVEAFIDTSGRLNLKSIDGRAIRVSGTGGSLSGIEGQNNGRLTLTRLDAKDIVFSVSSSAGSGLSIVGHNTQATTILNLANARANIDSSAAQAIGWAANSSQESADISGGIGAGVTSLKGAMAVMDIAESAQKMLDTIRADLGPVQNQLVSTINNISVTQVNVKAAESQIRDVDFAAESASFSKYNILAQSGSYAMSQANAVQQNVLKLLQ